MILLWILFNLLCVWLFTGKWEKFDRVFAFGLSCLVTPIIGIPLTKILSRFWH
jgi:hypothetical protein